MSARLPDRIRNKEGLSYGVGSQFSAPIKDDGGSFLAYAISNPQNAPKVEVSIKDELAKTEKDGFTSAELAAAQKAWLQERVLGRSQDGSLAGLLASAGGGGSVPGASAAPAAAPVAEAAPVEKFHEVKSPIVGTFYDSPSPGAPMFVKVGDERD